jgi:hypothetical protein
MLRAVAFFAVAMFTQTFDNIMMPPKGHILGTPNRGARLCLGRTAGLIFRYQIVDLTTPGQGPVELIGNVIGSS